MIEINISRELAIAHPRFMARCAQSGHAVNVFDSAAPEARPHRNDWGCDGPGPRGRRRGVARDRSAGGNEPTGLTSRSPAADVHDLRRPTVPAPNRTERRPSYGLRQARRRAALGVFNVPVNTSAPEILAPGPTEILTGGPIHDGKP